MRHARAVMHVEIANPPGVEHVPAIPGPCATRNFTYLLRGPLAWLQIIQARSTLDPAAQNPMVMQIELSFPIPLIRF